MNIIEQNGISAVVVDKELRLNNVRDILDVIASAQYNYHCVGMIVYRESLGDEFFDLSTGYAGEVLQKFSNYNMKIAIIGDFSHIVGKSLRDFIYECNNGNRVFFKASVEEGLDAF